MAKLKTPAAGAAYLELMAWAPDEENEADRVEFEETLNNLIRTVQDEIELALMKGKIRFMGEPYMLYQALEFVVGMERRPLHRDAAIKQIQDALHKYLGLDFTPQPKRKRRKLLPNV